MEINFETPVTFSVTKKFNGSMEDGRTFTLLAEWNDWDGWSVDSIECDSEDELTEDEEQEISDHFIENMED